jgi:hypothetical protein
MILLSLMVVQANALERYLRFLLADDPFRGLYAPNAFDLLTCCWWHRTSPSWGC